MFDNLQIAANTRFPVYIGFNFLADSLAAINVNQNSHITEYNYQALQYQLLNDSSSLLGGQHFIVRKQPITNIVADAGVDRTVSSQQPVTISAKQLSEAAIYNWYDMDGNLIYEGKDLNVSPEVTEKYKLEVIGAATGVKDYDEVQVKVKQSYLKTITPNPTSGLTTVNYVIKNCNSAYFMLLNQTFSLSHNYIIDVNQNSSVINLQGFTPGIYTLVLICDGEAKDAKQLMIQ